MLLFFAELPNEISQLIEEFRKGQWIIDHRRIWLIQHRKQYWNVCRDIEYRGLINNIEFDQYVLMSGSLTKTKISSW